jgi:hypothetical protein
MSIVQLIESYMDDQVLFGQRHILIHLLMECCVSVLERLERTDTAFTYLERFIKVPNLAKIVQELVDS